MGAKKMMTIPIVVSLMMFSQIGFGQSKQIKLEDLSAFNNPSKSWTIVGDVTANISKSNTLESTKGTGILLATSNEKNPGSDLFTNEQFGNVVLELDYLMSKGGNSGVYLQGNYEIQLEDSWGITNPTSANNGGIYSRWDETRPKGQEGFGGFAPRQNVSKAPGLWQHLKIVFQAPKFDASGNKTENARIFKVELNGVLIHENIELLGPTRGNVGKEVALAPLRLQGDHGSVAFRNISISNFDKMAPKQESVGADPIFVDAKSNVSLRSFVPLEDNTLAPHGISVGGPEQVNFSYDLDKGMLLKAWHGLFLDATRMWDGRGDGVSEPRGAVTYFTKKLIPAVAMLESAKTSWPKDTVGSGYKPKGYILDSQDLPEFKYITHGVKVTDAIKAMSNGHGLERNISVDGTAKNLYVLLANASNITEIEPGFYELGDKSYYIRINETDGKPIIRDNEGMKQLIIPIGSKLNYSILF